MTPIERLILLGIKHIIEREKFTPEIRSELDNDFCNTIKELTHIRKSGSACDMSNLDEMDAEEDAKLDAFEEKQEK